MRRARGKTDRREHRIPGRPAADRRGRPGGKWLGPSREVRLSTSCGSTGIRSWSTRPAAELPITTTTLEPVSADLRWRGFSAEDSPDGREPFGSTTRRSSPSSPWKALPGRYTREGDVRPLLTRTDDMFVIAQPGRRDRAVASTRLRAARSRRLERARSCSMPTASARRWTSARPARHASGRCRFTR